MPGPLPRGAVGEVLGVRSGLRTELEVTIRFVHTPGDEVDEREAEALEHCLALVRQIRAGRLPSLTLLAGNVERLEDLKRAAVGQALLASGTVRGAARELGVTPATVRKYRDAREAPAASALAAEAIGLGVTGQGQSEGRRYSEQTCRCGRTVRGAHALAAPRRACPLGTAEREAPPGRAPDLLATDEREPCRHGCGAMVLLSPRGRAQHGRYCPNLSHALVIIHRAEA